MNSKYKEQMSKITVDNEMKKRVMENLKQVKLEEKVKRPLFGGQALYKYGGIAAACCAFIATFAITIKYPYIINQKDSKSAENQYAADSYEDENTTNENVNKRDENNSVVNDKYDESNESQLNNKDNNVNIENVYENKDYKEINDRNVENNNSTTIEKEEKNTIDSNLETKAADSEEDNIENISDNDEKSTVFISEDIEDSGNENLRIANYTENIRPDIRTKNDFENIIPNLENIGFNINYVNEISENEVQIMYTNNNDNILIDINNKKDNIREKYYFVTSNIYLNGKEVLLCGDSKDSIKCAVYTKDEYSYSITGNVNMEKDIIENIIENIK